MKTKEPQACDVTGNRFRILIILLRTGSVPVYMRNPSLLISVYNVLSVLHAIALYIAFCMDIIVHRNDLKNFMKAFRLLNSATLILWNYFSLRWRLHDFERLLRLTESFTWEDQPTRDPHTGHHTLAGWIPHLQKLWMYILGFSYFFHILQSGVRMLVYHELMFPAWYPFDTVNSPGYELAIFMQTFATPIYMTNSFSFPLLYATVVMVACSQLQKLRTNLLDIKQELVPSGADSGSDGGEESVSHSEDGFCRMQTQLNECVRHHQAILQYMRALEDTINFTLCGAFLIMLAALCFVSFSAVTTWDGTHATGMWKL
ncbi:uncharacterized protein LOC111869588 [Cryptotermes secundus]|uniref:uncharacterized protein LOC111869588 n=1 Tax=Cryptotermes secundus TaxID=105785 RepID=UPI001454E376|nr:uncharacterized protein LOC111869588 [Cryptotermes secundus]